MNKKKVWIPCLLLLLYALAFAGCREKEEASLLAQGMALVEELNYQEALACFEQELKAEGDVKGAYRGLGMAYMGLADYDQAVAAFENALGQAGGRIGRLEYDVSYYLAAAEYKRGNPNGAIAAYTAILNLKPKEAGAAYLRGTLYAETGAFEDALKDFDLAVKNDPSNYDLYIDIYRCLSEYGQQEAAAAYLAAAYDAGGEISHFQKGRLAYYQGDYENARNLFELSRSGAENVDEVTLYLGKTYDALEDTEYAISLYENYLSKNPEDTAVYNQLGLCRMKTGAYEGALKAFQAALEIEEGSFRQTLRFNEAVAYEYLNDFETAARLMGEYQKSYPDDQTAAKEYQFLKTR